MYKIYKSVRSDTPWEIYFNEGDNLPYAPIGSTAYNTDTGVIMINDGEKWVEKIGASGGSGQSGMNGKTPIRGIDYWTEEDKTEIVNDVLAQIVDGNEVAY